MSGMMTENGILVRQGDSFDITMHFKKKDGSDMDISNAQIILSVKDGSGSAVFLIEGDVTNGAQGKAVIKITPAYSAIEVGEYEANIKVIFANGDVHTIFPQDLSRNAMFKISERA